MEKHQIVQLLGSWSDRQGPLYVRLAAAIEQSIRTGEFPAETRLPSERWLAHHIGVSRSTVVAAYSLLEDREWVIARRGSGTRVAKCSPQRSLHLRRQQLSALARSPVIDSYFANPSAVIDFSTGAPAWPTGLDAALGAIRPDQMLPVFDAYGYAPQGLPDLRIAIAEHYNQAHLKTKPEQILVTNGAQQAISLLATIMLQRGDTIILENPTFFGAIDAFRGVGARLAIVPIGVNGLDFSRLDEHLAARKAQCIYLIPTFHNPTGNTLNDLQRREIVRKAQAVNMPIIEDLTLSLNALDCDPPPPLACYGPEGAVITIGSLSKIIWAGLRIGWIRGSVMFIERLARLKAITDLGSSLVSQMIGVQLFPRLKLVQQLRREELNPRLDLVIEILQRQVPTWHWQKPQGGLFLWVQLPHGDTRDLAQVALHCGVKVTPGTTLSIDSSHTTWLRLPYFLPPNRLQLGLHRLIGAWERYAKMSD